MKHVVIFWLFVVTTLIALGIPVQEKDGLADTLRQESVTLCRKKEVANGSGIVVRHGNHVFIWTAAHVVGDCKRMRVYQLQPDGSRLHNRATVMISDPIADIAVLRVEFMPGMFKYSASIAKQPPRYGEKILHVGSFLGDKYPASFSSGVVSWVQRNFPGSSYMQISAPAFPGSSGGGVFNESGVCIGMLVRQADPSITFCVPAVTIRQWAKQHQIEFAL